MLELGHIEVDSADFWTNRWLSSSSRSTAEELASFLSHGRASKSGRRFEFRAGTSDPYVVVKWDGVDKRTVGKCAPEKRTVNPRWGFHINLSVPMTQPDNLFAAIVLEVFDHDPSPLDADDFLGLCVIDPHELTMAAESGKLVTRRLLDRDEKGRLKREAAGTLSWRVSSNPSICALRRRLADRVRKSVTANHLDGTKVKFEVLRATRLVNTDGKFGLADPYVNVVVAGVKIGRTSCKPNTLNPVWPGDGSQAFTLRNVPTLGQSRDHGNYLVRFGIFDMDIGKDDRMGEAALPWDLLMKEGEHELPIRNYVIDPTRARDRALKYRKHLEGHIKMHQDGNQSAEQRAEGVVKDVERIMQAAATTSAGRRMDGRRVGVVAGDGRVKKGPTNKKRRAAARGPGATLFVRVWHVARVRLHVNGAHELRAADIGILHEGRADPYAKIRYKGKELARTRVAKSTLDPAWYAVFEFDIPTYSPSIGGLADLLVEVYDWDLVGSHDFLGCVAVSQDCMLRPHCGDIWELGPRFNASAKDPVVSGFLDLQVEASFIPRTMEPIPWPRAPPEHAGSGDVEKDEALKLIQKQMADLKEAQRATDKLQWSQRDIRMAKDEKTGRKYWYERLRGRAARDGNGDPVDASLIPRWWSDPRPVDDPPPSAFEVPVRPPRPSPTKRKYARLNELKPGEPNYEFRPTAVVECNVLRAGGLKNADGGLLSGSSDPYATVRYGPAHSIRTVGRTKVINNCNDPVWGEDPFRFPIYLDADCADYQIMIELWDSDGVASGGKDDALGMCVFTVDEYINSRGPLRRVLRPQPGETDVTGYCEIRVSLLGQVRVHLLGLEPGRKRARTSRLQRLRARPISTRFG